LNQTYLQRADRRNQEKLDLIFPQDLSNEELLSRLHSIRRRYHRGRLGRAVISVATAVLVGMVLPPFSLVQGVGVVGVGVMYLVTRSVGRAKLAHLEDRVDTIIREKSEGGRIGN
jgi:hypothetical protein